MTNEEYEFVLQDRIAKIQSINEQYNLLDNSYISFSGGRDSVVLSKLIDLALPNNKIPRVYFNTGIEYKAMVDFVKDICKNDSRFEIINSGINIKNMLNENGYPFKSKQHSYRLAIYQNQNNIIDCNNIEKIREQAETKKQTFNDYGEIREETYKDYHIPKTIVRYLGVEESKTKFRCPEKLLYQFTNNFKQKMKVSYMCCSFLKKDISKKYQETSSRKIVLTGMRKDEGGQRASISCVVTDKENNLLKFHPLLVVSDEWETELIERERERVCELYLQPYNFKRTGCVCCPYGLNLQEELELLYKYLPNEYYKAINIWKPVYDEYIRLGYRLKYYPHERGIQLSLEDFLEEENN